MKNIKYFITLLAALMIGACDSGGNKNTTTLAELGGNWTVTLDTPDCSVLEQFNVDLTQDSNLVTWLSGFGVLNSTVQLDGSLTGDAVLVEGSFSNGETLYTFNLAGTVVADDRMEGNVEVTLQFGAKHCETNVNFKADRNVVDVDTPPAAPDGLQAFGLTASSIAIDWNDNSDNETGFVLERSLSADSGFEAVDTYPAGTTEVTDFGLEAEKTYFYRVKAINDAGDSGYSDVSNASTTPAPAQPPTPPSGLTLLKKSSTVISMSWSDNSDNETGFIVEHATGLKVAGPVLINAIAIDPALNCGNFTALPVISRKGSNQLPPNTTTFTHTGLTAGSFHCYRIRAVNENGESEASNILTETTPILSTR